MPSGQASSAVVLVGWQLTSAACWPSQELLNKVDPSLLGKVPLSYFLGTLGMPGE